MDFDFNRLAGQGDGGRRERHHTVSTSISISGRYGGKRLPGRRSRKRGSDFFVVLKNLNG